MCLLFDIESVMINSLPFIKNSLILCIFGKKT